jgi:hypothetical protein
MSTLSRIGLCFLTVTTRKYRVAIITTSILLPLLGAVTYYSLPWSNFTRQLDGL